MKLTPYLIKNILLVGLENEQVWSMPSCMLKMTLKFENSKIYIFGEIPLKGKCICTKYSIQPKLNRY